MAGGGAAAAAIIAARERRVQEVVDAFRLGDATAPDRARTFSELGVAESGESRDLLVEGILLPGPRDGTYYLSEAGMIYRRNDRRGLKAVAIVMALLLVIGLFVATRLVVRG